MPNGLKVLLGAFMLVFGVIVCINLELFVQEAVIPDLLFALSITNCFIGIIFIAFGIVE